MFVIGIDPHRGSHAAAVFAAPSFGDAVGCGARANSTGTGAARMRFGSGAKMSPPLSSTPSRSSGRKRSASMPKPFSAACVRFQVGGVPCGRLSLDWRWREEEEQKMLGKKRGHCEFSHLAFRGGSSRLAT
jgi:hypothetical protein